MSKLAKQLSEMPPLELDNLPNGEVFACQNASVVLARSLIGHPDAAKWMKPNMVARYMVELEEPGDTRTWIYEKKSHHGRFVIKDPRALNRCAWWVVCLTPEAAKLVDAGVSEHELLCDSPGFTFRPVPRNLGMVDLFSAIVVCASGFHPTAGDDQKLNTPVTARQVKESLAGIVASPKYPLVFGQNAIVSEATKNRVPEHWR